MSKTKIEWTEHSWNPISGCSHVGSPGCDFCYARRMARRLAGRYGYPDAPHHFDVTLHPDRLDEPLKRKKPTTYFVCSMGDLFHEDVPFEFIKRIYGVMDASRRSPKYSPHIFQVLTKRSRRMSEFYYWAGIEQGHIESGALANVWLGVTAENQATADERIPLLLQTPAAVRFVSCEPLLGPVDLQGYLAEPCWACGRTGYGISDTDCPACGGMAWIGENLLDWVIVGGESGPGARPMHPQWARDIRDQCQAAGIAYFMKQMGGYPNKRAKLEDIPHDLQIREFPT